MRQNKALNISSGVIGTLFAAAHLALAAYLIRSMFADGITDLNGSGPEMLIVGFFFLLVEFVAIAAVIGITFAGLFYLASSMVTIFAKSNRARRVFAIINCVFISLEILEEVSFIFGTIVRGFRDGNYLSAFAGIMIFLTTVTWLVLNIILARKPKNTQ